MKIYHLVEVRSEQDLRPDRRTSSKTATPDSNSMQLVARVYEAGSLEGRHTFSIPRDSRELGDSSARPYLKDLFGETASGAASEDWLLYTDPDVRPREGFSLELAATRATAVELLRSGENRLGGLALRAGFYRQFSSVFPDLVAEAPHWDVVYSQLLRQLVPVKRLEDRLEACSPLSKDEVTFAERHNRSLLERAIEKGYILDSRLWEGEETTDTAIITSVFGECPLRLQATLEGLRKQLTQDLHCHHYVVELLEPDQESRLPRELLKNFLHRKVVCGPKNRGLFQKEALFNKAWKEALESHPYSYFIFTDADIYAEDVSWFRQIRDKLRQNPANIVHGYRVARDSLDPEFSFNSLGSLYSSEFQTDLPVNPGLVWGFHRKMLEVGDGFNPYCIECAGDSALVTEYLNEPGGQYDNALQRWPWYQEIKRELPFRAGLDAVPVDITHCFHGPAATRNYHEVRRALSQLGPLKESVVLDAEGLLAWKDPDCLQAKILPRRAELSTSEDVERVLAEYGVPMTVNELKTEIIPSRKLLDWPHEMPPVLRNGNPFASPVVSAHFYPIFAPYRVFGEEFPPSWSDKIRTFNGARHIPMKRYPDSFRLRLEGLPEEPYIVGIVALQPTWMPVDITRFDLLSLSLYAEGQAFEVILELLSWDEHEQDVASNQVKLFPRGFQPGRECHYEIALEDFFGRDAFRPDRVRSLKLLGYGSFALEAWEIFFKTSS